MVVVVIATEIINAGMIWRRLFAFIQPFNPWLPDKLRGLRVSERHLPHFFAKCGQSKATDTANEHLDSPGSKARIFARWRPVRVSRTFWSLVENRATRPKGGLR